MKWACIYRCRYLKVKEQMAVEGEAPSSLPVEVAASLQVALPLPGLNVLMIMTLAGT